MFVGAVEQRDELLGAGVVDLTEGRHRSVLSAR
jgi:hypothetical protein